MRALCIGSVLCVLSILAQAAEPRPALPVTVTVAAPTAAHEPTSAEPAPADAADLGTQERAARDDLTLARVRLEIISARRELRDAATMESAARRAQRALQLLRTVSPDRDTSELELQGEGVLARAARAGVVIEREAGAGASSAGASVGNGSLSACDRPCDRCGGPACRHAGGPDTPTRRRLEQNSESWRAQDWIKTATAETELRALRSADEAGKAPRGDVEYPPDWPERTRRRAAQQGAGMISSPSWVGADGRQWNATVYDITDLTYVPPDFTSAVGVNPALDAANALDRDALRLRSMIFSGDARDLAAGLPLLNYLGGVDPYLIRGPKYSRERQQAIVDLIDGFLSRPDTARVISIPEPVR
jgi:hypothetical protein